MQLTYTEREANNNADLGRVQILGVNLGRYWGKVVLGALQFLRMYPKA